MNTTQPALPSWAKLENEDGREKVMVNVDLAYPAYLAELNMGLNQYSVGLAQQCCMREITDLMGGACWIKLYSSTGSETYKLLNLPIHSQYLAGGDDMSRQNVGIVWAELKQKREQKAATESQSQ